MILGSFLVFYTWTVVFCQGRFSLHGTSGFDNGRLRQPSTQNTPRLEGFRFGRATPPGIKGRFGRSLPQKTSGEEMKGPDIHTFRNCVDFRLDLICQQRYGPNSRCCEDSFPPDMCSVGFRCSDEGACSGTAVGTNGTPCGTSMWCQLGQCIGNPPIAQNRAATEGPTIADNCGCNGEEELTTTKEPSSTKEPTTTEEPTTKQGTTEEPVTTIEPTTTEESTTTKTTPDNCGCNGEEELTTTEEPSSTKEPTTQQGTTEEPATTKEPTTTEEPTTTKKPTTTEQPQTTTECFCPFTTVPPTTTEKVCFENMCCKKAKCCKVSWGKNTKCCTKKKGTCCEDVQVECSENSEQKSGILVRRKADGSCNCPTTTTTEAPPTTTQCTCPTTTDPSTTTVKMCKENRCCKKKACCNEPWGENTKCCTKTKKKCCVDVDVPCPEFAVTSPATTLCTCPTTKAPTTEQICTENRCCKKTKCCNEEWGTDTKCCKKNKGKCCADVQVPCS